MSKELMETGKHQISLVTAVRHNPQMLPTPTASMMPCEGTVRIMRKAWESGEYTLEEASAIAGRDVRLSQGKVPTMETFPTPQASDIKLKPTSASWKAKGGINYSLANPEIQAKWGTPKAQDSRHALTDRGKGNLGEQVSGIHNGGKLNPPWTEWLMGWPIGWSAPAPLATDRFRQWLDSHGTSCPAKDAPTPKVKRMKRELSQPMLFDPEPHKVEQGTMFENKRCQRVN
jgi:hypothetical protein